jgi:hypothetical protein
VAKVRSGYFTGPCDCDRSLAAVGITKLRGRVFAIPFLPILEDTPALSWSSRSFSCWARLQRTRLRFSSSASERCHGPRHAIEEAPSVAF